VFSQTYPAVPESAVTARTAVGDFAMNAGTGPSTVADVRLAVSEAATNVVVHAYRDAGSPGLIRVEATVKAGELRVRVADEGSGFQPNQRSPGLGLGLGIIARLTDSLELLQREGGGIQVVMRFAARR
jgi:anti-sigma regulatory factor (Ser/Thr protein kinase)